MYPHILNDYRGLAVADVLKDHTKEWDGDVYFLPTKDTYKRLIFEALKTAPFITTLEIKGLLRDEGFWAQQRDVSETMQKMVADGELTMVQPPNLPYTQYLLPSAACCGCTQEPEDCDEAKFHCPACGARIALLVSVVVSQKE